MEEYLAIDEVLKYTGEFGLYQKVLEFIVCISYTAGIYQIFLPYFAVYNPPWRCVANSSLCTLTGSFKRGEQHYEDRCSFPRHEWEYTQQKDYSVVTEFDLSCAREDLKYIDTSLFFITWAIGSIILGWLADRYGRRKIIFISSVMLLSAAFISAFSPAYWFYVLTRAVIGLFSPGFLVMPFIYLSEVVGPKYRPLTGIMLFVVGSMAICIVGLHAYFIRKWRLLLMGPEAYSTIDIASQRAVGYLFNCFLLFIPESIRWLRIKNRLTEVHDLLNKIAKWNKQRIPEHVRVKPVDNTEVVNQANLLDLFRPRGMLLKSLALGFAWFTNAMIYYGIALAADNLGGSMYRDYTLSALVGLFGDIASIIVSTRFGRKKTVIIPMFIAAVACIAAAIVPLGKTTGLDALRLTFGLVGKFCIQVSFDVIYTWSVELYPTVIRSEGIGWLQVTSRIGSALSPWVTEWLKVFHIILPFSIMGGTCFLSAIFLLHLPETKEQPTAEVICANPNIKPMDGLVQSETVDTCL
eukprot:gene20161-22136_t